MDGPRIDTRVVGPVPLRATVGQRPIANDGSAEAASQLAIYSVHELSEAGVFTSEAVLRFHMATEPFSPYGRYGRWFTWIMVAVPALLLFEGFLRDRALAPSSGGSRR